MGRVIITYYVARNQILIQCLVKYDRTQFIQIILPLTLISALASAGQRDVMVVHVRQYGQIYWIHNCVLLKNNWRHSKLYRRLTLFVCFSPGSSNKFHKAFERYC